jgi:hypothetical protein
MHETEQQQISSSFLARQTTRNVIDKAKQEFYVRIPRRAAFARVLLILLETRATLPSQLITIPRLTVQPRRNISML